MQVDWETESVAVTTRKRVKGLRARMKKRTVTSGCGQGTMFGNLMEEIERSSCATTCASATRSSSTSSRRCASTKPSTSSRARCTAARLRARPARRSRDPDVRRGRRAPQRGRRDRRLHVARGHRRRGQDLLHHRPADERDGDQVRADAHSRSSSRAPD